MFVRQSRIVADDLRSHPVRKYVMMKCGFLASGAQRKPRAVLSKTAPKEVDHLLARLNRVVG